MISSAIPFEEIIENLKDDTGLENLRSQYERIKRFIFRAESKIGYSGALVLKKISYESTNTNFNGTKLNLPNDWIEFFGLKDSCGPISGKEYIVYPTHIQFCSNKPRTDLELFYYGLMCDGYGNPIVPRNHAEAVNSFLIWKLFGRKAFLDPTRHARGVVKSYEQDWKDYRDAAQGDDAWPVTQEEWDTISGIMNMSSKEAESLVYLQDNLESLCALEMKSECVLPEEVLENVEIYYWQYDNLIENINNSNLITLDFLNNSTIKSSIEDFNIGKTVIYNKVGRIAFALSGVTNKEFKIYDILNQEIRDVVFDNYYDQNLNLDIYVSKEYYSHSNMFFKFTK